MNRDPDVLALALAAAFLDGEWTVDGLTERGAAALAVKPGRMRPIVTEVLAAYRSAPVDRRRELASFIGMRPQYRILWHHGRAPVLVEHPLPVARAARLRWAVPSIDTIQDLADWAGMSTSQLDWYADIKSLERRAHPRLRHYDREWTYSRRGRIRLLERPRSGLKALQRRLLHEVLNVVPTHDAANGFVAHRSIQTFAAPHVGRDVVIRLDLAAFFSSIAAGRAFGVWRMLGYPEAVAHVMTGLVTTAVPLDVVRLAPEALRTKDLSSRRRLLADLAHPHLPQGSPTSPALANLVAYRLDGRLAGLATAASASYTRYADDLALSLQGDDAARRARRLIDGVRRIVHEEGFRVNDAKTRVMTRAQRQRLCGVVVNDSLGVARQERDALRALLFNCRRHGPESQNRSRHANFAAHVLGRIAWVAAVNPDQGAKLRAQFDEITWPSPDHDAASSVAE